MNVVGLYVAIVGGGLFLLSLGVLAVAQLRERPPETDDRSPASIIARVQHERAEEARAKAPTEVLPAISPDDVPTVPFPAYVPLPRRRRPYVDRPPTPWPRKRFGKQPDQEVMQRILDGLKRL